MGPNWRYQLVFSVQFEICCVIKRAGIVLVRRPFTFVPKKKRQCGSKEPFNMSLLLLGLEFGLLVQTYFIFCIIFSTIQCSQWLSREFNSLPRKCLELVWRQLGTSNTLKRISVWKIITPDGSVNCIHDRFAGGKPCLNGMTRHSMLAADERLNCLMTCHPRHDSAWGVLDTYARFRLCHKHKKLSTENTNLWDDQIEMWLGELEAVFYRELYDVLSAESEPLQGEVLKLMKSKFGVEISAPRFDIPGEFPASQPTELIENDDGDDQDEEGKLSLPNDRVITRFLKRYEDCFKSTPFDNPPDSVANESIPTDFTSFPMSSKADVLSELVERQLTESERAAGCIYIYRTVDEDQPFNSTHVKIGYSTKDPKIRLTQWKAGCGRDVQFVESFIVHHAKRAEALIFRELELRGKRRLDHRCKFRPGRCTSIHNEWFEITEKEAIEVVEHWTSWMNSHKPYSTAGTLKLEMIRAMHSRRGDGACGVREIEKNVDEGPDFLSDSRGDCWYAYRNTILLKKSVAASTHMASPTNSTTMDTGTRSKSPKQQSSSTGTDPSCAAGVSRGKKRKSMNRYDQSPSEHGKRNLHKSPGPEEADENAQDVQRSNSSPSRPTREERGRISTTPHVTQPTPNRSEVSKQDSGQPSNHRNPYLTPQRPTAQMDRMRQIASDSKYVNERQRKSLIAKDQTLLTEHFRSKSVPGRDFSIQRYSEDQ